jgi:2-hydroxychromene-2-carboxylate isomerase
MQPLEFWFDHASTYSYVAAERIEKLAAAAGVEVRWRPFLLGPIFTQQLGIKTSPFNVFPVRGRYMWRDVERLCEKFGIPWRRPSGFPRNGLLAARVSCAAGDAPWEPAFHRAVLRANFVDDRDIAEPLIIREILERLGQDGGKLLERAGTQEVKQVLYARGNRAELAGIFGAPSFIVGDELFFGQDRLEDAIDWARTH